MTPKLGFHTLVAMYSDAQLLYLEEVLGVNARDLQARPSGKSATLVLAGAITEAERELLKKILASVNLPDVRLEESFDPPSDVTATHTLIFSGQGEGRTDATWIFPKLGEMLGNGAEVAAKKKATWNLLQQLAKEVAR